MPQVIQLLAKKYVAQNEVSHIFRKTQPFPGTIQIGINDTKHQGRRS
jgi:hypothetical protein